MNTVLRTLLAVAGLAIGAVAAFALIERAAIGERGAERRALLTREAELNRLALTPGSPLSCLDAGAGETVENACEKLVFSTAQSTAGAVAYMDARLRLLAEAAATGDVAIQAALVSTRRAVALDRYGIAAHVLAIRDGCTAAKCAAFALVGDASALKSNLKAQVYDQYVSRYAADWNAPAVKPPAVAAAPAPAPLASMAPPQPATTSGLRPTAAVKPGEKWDFPSADSIPAVSIMNSEPSLPKAAEAEAPAGDAAPAATTAKAEPAAKPPIPPKRPPAPPPAAR